MQDGLAKISTGTTNVKKQVVTSYEIKREGRTFSIPEEITYDDAIKALQAQKVYEESFVSFNDMFPGYFVLDSAYCFYMALLEMFGIVHQQSIRTFFGEKPPKLIQVKLPSGESVDVPWGRVAVPLFEGGFIDFAYGKSGDFLYFEVNAQLKRKHASIMKSVSQLANENLKSSSIYKGRAIEVNFDVDPNFPIPEVNYLSLGSVKRSDLIFNRDTEIQIETNLFSPIVFQDQARKAGVSPKWGVLLAGQYGVGKSLTAKYVSKIAIENNITYIYIKDPKYILHAYELAKIYSPAVLFVEDVDQILSGERNEFMNKVANLLDGVSNKHLKIITVFTTNHVERINPVFLRYGRFDQIVMIDLPDAEAVQRLIKYYSGDSLEENQDLAEIGELLNNQSPSTIKACVEKAKLYQVSLSHGADSKISAEALLASAKQMTRQMELIREKQPEPEIKVDMVKMSDDVTLTNNVLFEISKEIAEIKRKL